MEKFAHGYDTNSDVIFKKIKSIRIENFRGIENKELKLGNNITLIAGKNGTMKSSMLALIAHPFNSPNAATDSSGKPLKIESSDIFRLSLDKDTEDYYYYITAETIADINFSEQIRVYKRKNDNENRHRVTVGKHKVGHGNYSLNTTYISLKRLYPLIDTKAKKSPIIKDDDRTKFISRGYEKVLQKTSFKRPSDVLEKGVKNTYAPSEDALYDYQSISSGEDNLGHILDIMYSLQKYSSKKNDGRLEGILCIDEVDASLHPVAQENLFNFLLTWSKDNNIQVVFTTHSLYLIQYAIQKQKELSNYDDISLVMISTDFVKGQNYNFIHNPPYTQAYAELTFKTLTDFKELYKIKVLCEDELAKLYLTRILKSRKFLDHVDFIFGISSKNSGSSTSSLRSIMTNGQKLLNDAIVVFDSDVPEDSVPKNEIPFLILPSIYKLALEKEIAKYIYSLDGDNDFFLKFKKSKSSFENDFAQKNILSVLDDNDALQKANVKAFKKWSSSDTSFKQYLTYYVKNNPSIIDPFRKNLIQLINDKLSKKSFPRID